MTKRAKSSGASSSSSLLKDDTEDSEKKISLSKSIEQDEVNKKSKGGMFTKIRKAIGGSTNKQIDTGENEHLSASFVDVINNEETRVKKKTKSKSVDSTDVPTLSVSDETSGPKPKKKLKKKKSSMESSGHNDLLGQSSHHGPSMEQTTDGTGVKKKNKKKKITAEVSDGELGQPSSHETVEVSDGTAVIKKKKKKKKIPRTESGDLGLASHGPSVDDISENGLGMSSSHGPAEVANDMGVKRKKKISRKKSGDLGPPGQVTDSAIKRKKKKKKASVEESGDLNVEASADTAPAMIEQEITQPPIEQSDKIDIVELEQDLEEFAGKPMEEEPLEAANVSINSEPLDMTEEIAVKVAAAAEPNENNETIQPAEESLVESSDDEEFAGKQLTDEVDASSAVSINSEPPETAEDILEAVAAETNENKETIQPSEESVVEPDQSKEEVDASSAVSINSEAPEMAEETFEAEAAEDFVAPTEEVEEANELHQVERQFVVEELMDTSKAPSAVSEVLDDVGTKAHLNQDEYLQTTEPIIQAEHDESSAEIMDHQDSQHDPAEDSVLPSNEPEPDSLVEEEVTEIPSLERGGSSLVAVTNQHTQALMYGSSEDDDSDFGESIDEDQETQDNDLTRPGADTSNSSLVEGHKDNASISSFAEFDNDDTENFVSEEPGNGKADTTLFVEDGIDHANISRFGEVHIGDKDEALSGEPDIDQADSTSAFESNDISEPDLIIQVVTTPSEPKSTDIVDPTVPSKMPEIDGTSSCTTKDLSDSSQNIEKNEDSSHSSEELNDEKTKRTVIDDDGNLTDDEMDVCPIDSLLNKFQKRLDQEQTKSKMLEEVLASHRSRLSEQKEQMLLYQGMFKDAQEDYFMVLAKWDKQVKQNEAILQVVEAQKQRLQHKDFIISEGVAQIHQLQKQVSERTQSEEKQELVRLQGENKRLREMVDLQKKSLFTLLTGASVINAL